MALADLTEDNKFHTVSIPIRALCKRAGVALSMYGEAMKGLEDLGHITIRHGTTTRKTAFMCNFLSVVSVPISDTPTAQTDPISDTQVSLFPGHTVPIFDTPSTENKGPTPAAPTPLDFDSVALRLIDRVLSAKPKDFEPNLLAEFRAYLGTYMSKLGRDSSNRPLINPHPPKDDLVAQFLAIAEPRRLGTLLDSLCCDRQPCETYGWFLVVALQRIHGIHWQVQKQARETLRMVKRGQRQAAVDAGELADPQSSFDLQNEIEKIAEKKRMR